MEQDNNVQSNSENFLWETTIPLLNFTTDLEHAQISEQLELTPYTQKEKSSQRDIVLLLWGMLSSEDIKDPKFKLFGSYTANKEGTITISNPEIVNEARTLITALRLFKAGDVGITVVFNKSHPSGPKVNSTHTVSNCQVRQHGTNTYNLFKSELPKVLELFEKLKTGFKNDQLRSLNVAFRRFNQSYSRDIAEDRIIDLTIALESCLMSNQRDELRYRLSIRGAALLSDIPNPMETQSLLTAIYDARSAIVHDGKNLSELNKILRKVTPPLQPHELPQRCEDITRHILKTYIARLTKGKRLEEINNELDRRVVENLTLNSSTSP